MSHSLESSPVYRSDRARLGVPITLGVGVPALYIFPSLRIESDWEGSTTWSYSEVRSILGLAGYDWALTVAMLGILAAAAAAFFFPPSSPYPRRPIMGIGSLLGLLVPPAVFLADRETTDFSEFMSSLGAGMVVFSISCLLAATIGMASSVSQQGVAKFGLMKRCAEKLQKSIPITLGIGILALLILPSASLGRWSISFLDSVQGYDLYRERIPLLLGVIPVVVAIVASLSLPDAQRSVRGVVIGIASLCGLLISVSIILYFRREFSSQVHEWIGAGIVLYSIACLVAAWIGFQSRHALVRQASYGPVPPTSGAMRHIQTVDGLRQDADTTG